MLLRNTGSGILGLEYPSGGAKIFAGKSAELTSTNSAYTTGSSGESVAVLQSSLDAKAAVARCYFPTAVSPKS